MSNSQKRFSVGGFHIPYKLSEIQDTAEVLAMIDRLEIGESWDDGNGSETVTRLADADDLRRFKVHGLIYSTNEMQDIFRDDPEALNWIERAEIGGKYSPQPIDGMPIQIVRLMDTNYSSDGVTLTLTTEQLATMIHALGIAERVTGKELEYMITNIVNTKNHIPCPAETAMTDTMNMLAWSFADLNTHLAGLVAASK